MQGAAPAVFGVPLDFILFALTLLGVALFIASHFGKTRPRAAPTPRPAGNLGTASEILAQMAELSPLLMSTEIGETA